MTAKPKVTEILKGHGVSWNLKSLKEYKPHVYAYVTAVFNSAYAPYAHAYLCVSSELTDFQKQTKRESFPVPKGALS